MPLEDELLSSWIVRLSIAHGQKLHTFTRLLWKDSGIWARDVDKSVTKEQVKVLAEKCGVKFENAWETTLENYVGLIYETHKPLGPSAWITSVGINHRTRIKFGLQFCPQCLAEDQKPYFRRHWRLSFFTVCTKHEIQLLDCCPKCFSPVNFHRDELGNYYSFAPSYITRCYNCQFDLRKWQAAKTNLLPNELVFYNKLKDTAKNGFWMLKQNRPIHSLTFFAGLRQILKVLGMNDKRIQNLRNDLPHLYFQPISISRKTTDFPELRVAERRNFLLMASSLLTNWSENFVYLSKKHRIWSSLWLRHLEQNRDGVFKPCPFWFWETINEFLIHRRYQPTMREIEAAKSFLKANNQPIIAFRVCQLLNNFSGKLKRRIK